jgi:hypothetical protein
MEFLKKNYEKILLGLMLAGLVGVLVFMLFYIAADKQTMEERVNSLINPPVKALPNLDLTLQDNAVTRLQSPYNLDLESTNKLFNPMEWQKAADGHIFKISTGTEVGWRAVVITNISPLYLILSLDAVTTNEMGARYTIGIEKQAAAVVAKRRKQSRYVSVGEKPNDFFSLVEVKGAPENPDALLVKLVDSGEIVEVSKQKPYQRVEAYTVDFRYDPEKKVFRARRVGDRVFFYNTDYVLVDVTQNELVLLDQSNQKKNSLPFTH